MATLVTNIPPIQCYVRNQYLYNHEPEHPIGHCECFWVTAKSIPFSNSSGFNIHLNGMAKAIKSPQDSHFWTTIPGRDHMRAVGQYSVISPIP